ncbi:MAG: hypothetical protein C4336_05455 [Armatimonadota bacterium]|mgnify:CR=1 FL=1
MNCKQVEQKVWEYLDLTESERALLEAHLGRCDSCQAVWALAQCTLMALQHLPRYTASEACKARLRQRLQQAKPAPTRPRFQLRWKPLALAPALGLLLAWFWFKGSGMNSGETAQITSSYTSVEEYAQACVELHESLDVADWAPTPAVHYWVNMSNTR